MRSKTFLGCFNRFGEKKISTRMNRLKYLKTVRTHELRNKKA
jgi:hypothetical protein